MNTNCNLNKKTPLNHAGSTSRLKKIIWGKIGQISHFQIWFQTWPKDSWCHQILPWSKKTKTKQKNSLNTLLRQTMQGKNHTGYILHCTYSVNPSKVPLNGSYWRIEHKVTFLILNVAREKNLFRMCKVLSSTQCTLICIPCRWWNHLSAVEGLLLVLPAALLKGSSLVKKRSIPRVEEIKISISN